MMSLRHLFQQVKSSYSAKLIAIFIAALFAMAAILDITFIRLQQESFRKHMRDNGLAMTRLLAKSIQIDLFSENIEKLQTDLQALEDQGNILKVEVLTSDGSILVSRSFHESDAALYPSSATLLSDIDNSSTFFKEWQHTFTCWWPVLTTSEPVSDDDLYFDAFSTEIAAPSPEILGYVTMVISKEQYKEDLHSIFLRTGLIIIILLILLISGVFLAFRQVTEPLRLLISKIKRERNIGETHDDIGLLDSTVTNLVEDLDYAFQTINKLTSDLEDKVADRTRQLAVANSQLINRQEYLEETNAKLEKAIRDLKETESQLIQSEKMAAIGQVVAGVAHEINNNINFISGALPSLQRAMTEIRQLTDSFAAVCQDPSPERIEQAQSHYARLVEDELFDSLGVLMDNIHEGVTRTTKIITDLRTFSRADKDGSQTIDIHKAIDSTITFLDKEHLARVDIIKKYGELPLVPCHPDRINQVFLNIMNNALQAMAPEGGILTITTEHRSDEAHIRFHDTGIGISKENLPKIFDPFFTSKEIGEGSGIGLAISYKIIEQHGGRIEVRSDEGAGSTFEVILPTGNQLSRQQKK